MVLIGLDAASSLENFGYAIGRYDQEGLWVESAGLLYSRIEIDPLENRIAPLLRDVDRAIVAIDAPLGWPASMAAELKVHRAGEPIPTAKDDLFQRQTDRIVHERYGKKPLEIGADRIARAAHRALDVLRLIREKAGKHIPLAWSPRFTGVVTIEVYPAAMLAARGLPHSGYKKLAERSARIAIADGLKDDLPELARYVDANSNVFDACLCLAAAKDFVDGLAISPDDPMKAELEGWIWVRGRTS